MNEVFVLGVDFGTQSVRASIFSNNRGRLATGAVSCPVRRQPRDAHYATQSPAEQMAALTEAVAKALAEARIEGSRVAALAIDTTGSTVVPVGARLEPLDDFYLWCDHRAWRQAAAITDTARRHGLEALAWSGGAYSSEWGLAKVLHWLGQPSSRRSEFVTAYEHCDWIAAQLCGITDPDAAPRSICAMGHKWMWNAALGGLPPEEFLAEVDPLLKGVRARLASGRYLTSDQQAGLLSEDWANRLGLAAGVPVAAGALDAHWDAVGAGIGLGDVINVIGTSTCIMAIAPHARAIPGVSGVVQGSIHPGRAGIEAGLAAAGDLFDSIARRAGQPLGELSAQIQGHAAGQTGLLRMAWDNGDRTVLANPTLSGVTLGWTLAHTAADELFAAIEGTAFHTRIVLERMAEHGVPVERVIHAGGIPQRNETLNQVYANVLGKPVLVPQSDPTSVGAAIFAFLAAGVFTSVEAAQAVLSPALRMVEPDAAATRVYQDLYPWFRDTYFTLGASPLLPALARYRA